MTSDSKRAAEEQLINHRRSSSNSWIVKGMQQDGRLEQAASVWSNRQSTLDCQVENLRTSPQDFLPGPLDESRSHLGYKLTPIPCPCVAQLSRPPPSILKERRQLLTKSQHRDKETHLGLDINDWFEGLGEGLAVVAGVALSL
jgi:hypothetical protein